MPIKSGVVLVALASALYWGHGSISQGQTPGKSPAAAKKDSDAQKKPVGAAQPGTARANKPIDQGRRPADGSKPAGAKASASESADETAIRASARAFTKLYNDHDSEGLAALFAPRAEMIDEQDQVVSGRQAIERAFAEVFEANPKSSMQVDVESIRVLTPNLAIEEGTARSKVSKDDSEGVTTYLAIHVKLDGKWLLACVRDWNAPLEELAPHDHLQDLAWLVGDWVEESPESVIRTSCTWCDNGSFLIQEFDVHVGGDVAMSGSMRIGWDAVRKQFKSWVFDSKGGHAEGNWLRDGDQWIVKSRGATAAGEAASATSVYVPVDDETIIWSSFDRVVNGERLENIEPIIVKRRPPLLTE